MGFDAHITKVLVDLCTHRNRLPQGAPTSPALSNLVAAKMDERLTALSLRRGLTYTRYADDLTFSGDSFNRNELIADIKHIAACDGFTLNAKKTHLMASSRRIVTGLSIGSGEKLTLPRERKREIRKNVHFVFKYGVTEHRQCAPHEAPERNNHPKVSLSFISHPPFPTWKYRSAGASGIPL